MKIRTQIAAAVMVACVSVPVLAQQPATPPASGSQAQPTPLTPAEMDKQFAKMQEQMVKMNEQMAKMSPDQRKQVEEMMGKNGAKAGSGAPGGGMSVRICMTKEMVERNELPAQQGDCKTTQQSRSGNTMKMAFSCTKPPSSGEGQVTFVSPEAYTSKMVMTSMASGKPQKIDMEGSGKWLGADCGSIKPIALPKK